MTEQDLDGRRRRETMMELTTEEGIARILAPLSPPARRRVIRNLIAAHEQRLAQIAVECEALEAQIADIDRQLAEAEGDRS